MMPSATLKERQSPEARVYAYIKDPAFGNQIGGSNGTSRVFVQLNGFRNVSATTSMTSGGSASVTFPNFKGALMRHISLSNILSTEKVGQGKETTNDWSWNHFMEGIANPVSNNAFSDLWKDVILSRGETGLVAYNTKGVLSDSSFIERSRSRGDVINTQTNNNISYANNSNSTVQTITDQGLIYVLPFINLFDPIFIDFKGQDGKWYAKFTGLVTRLSENYQKMGDQSITLQCRDLTCLMDNVSLISGWNMQTVAEKETNLNDFCYFSASNIAANQKSAYESIFSNFPKVTDIILAVVRTAQDMWRFESGNSQVIKGDMGIRAFMFDTSQVYPYEGISGMRGSIELQKDDLEGNLAQYKEQTNPAQFFDKDNADGSLSLNDFMYSEIKNKFGASLKLGKKLILVDPLIMEMDQIVIQKLLNKDFSLFKDSLKSADQILNEIASKLFAYKYFDGNGNLVFELAKPNALPNLTEYAGRSSSTSLLHNTATASAPATAFKYYTIKAGDTLQKVANDAGISLEKLFELNGGKNTNSIFGKTENGTYVFRYVGSKCFIGTTSLTTSSPEYDIKNNSILPTGVIATDGTTTVLPKGVTIPSNKIVDYHKYTTLKWHGKNYLLSADDFNSFNSAFDEAALTTVVTTNAELPLGVAVNNIRPAGTAYTGVAVADFRHLAMLGIRRFQTQSLYNVQWPDSNAGSKVLSYQSAAILERVNSMADSGGFSMNQRPELQLGRTFINPLRMKSYLITSLTDSWSAGSPHTTVIAATYGHPLHKTLEVPWLAIKMEPKVFFEKGEDTTIFSKITAIDADGKPVTNTTGAAEVVVKAE